MNESKQITRHRNLFIIVALCISTIFVQSQNTDGKKSATWKIDNITSIGGFPVTVFGNPSIREFPDGNAMVFDGIDDGLIVQGCPLNKSAEFTMEMIFRPDSSFPNNIEQRFLHIQKPSMESRRMLLELRLDSLNRWIVDTHIRADSTFLTSLAKEFPHSVDRWYHIALVYKDGIASHYVNGVREMSGNVQYIPLDSAHVSIGMRMNRRSFFRGAVRSVRLTAAALEPSAFMPLPPAGAKSIKEIYKELQYADDFEKPNNDWISEFENPSTSRIAFSNGKLDISASAGASIWYKKKLSGNILITYDAVVKDNKGANDRVSDLNAFWMATDPKNINLFTRNGKFSSYDNLNLYYSGIGGHDNETTRFRKYFSNGEKPVITEYLDKDHLLKGNTLYKITIVVNEGRIQQYVNDVLYFDHFDLQPYTEGYFAFRTTRSHQIMDNFKVYQLLGSKK